jgi:hypothetical protein
MVLLKLGGNDFSPNGVHLTMMEEKFDDYTTSTNWGKSNSYLNI